MMIKPIKPILRRLLKNQVINRFRNTFNYVPYLPEEVDVGVIIDEVSTLLRLNPSVVEQKWRDYSSFSAAKDHSQLLGEHKTLSTDEAFIMYVLLNLFRPEHITEIGTQYGKSTRRLIDIETELSLTAPIECFDISNEVKWFTPHEAQLHLRDLTDSFKSFMLSKPGQGLIYLDAHPYALLKSVVEGVLSTDRFILAIHDCSPNLCNPWMSIHKDDPNVTTGTGVWERYVLAEAFDVSDVKSERLNWLMKDEHTLRIFSTIHGLGVILPHALLTSLHT